MVYKFVFKYEKFINVWVNVIGGVSLNSGGNILLYGISVGVDVYFNEKVEVIVGGFGSYGYSFFNN